MLRRTIILSVLLSCFVFTNSYNFMPKSKQTYYEKNNWDFVENYFIGDINNTKSNYDLIPKAIFAAPYVWMLSFLSYDYLKNGRFHEEILPAFSVLSFVLIIPMFLIYIKADELVYNKSLEDKILKSLKMFLKNYDPDLNSSLKVNFKKFMPKEFHEVFDDMYCEYKKYGDKSLKDVLAIVYSIRSNVMYDVKSNKYKKPDVIIVH